MTSVSQLIVNDRPMAHHFVKLSVGRKSTRLTLQSYQTDVAQTTVGGSLSDVVLDPKWCVSKTTTRAVAAFLNITAADIRSLIKQGTITIKNLN